PQELVHRNSFEDLNILEELVGHERLPRRSRCAVWLCLRVGRCLPATRPSLRPCRSRDHQAHDRYRRGAESPSSKNPTPQNPSPQNASLSREFHVDLLIPRPPATYAAAPANANARNELLIVLLL